MSLNNDFLLKYSDNINKALSLKDKTFRHVLKLLNEKSYVSYTDFNYQDTYDYLSDCKAILDLITSISFNPHIKATSEEVIIRSELASSLSSSSFKDTIKDSKLWKNKSGVMSPEYVHTQQHIDTFVTYENTFICLLVDAIKDDVDQIVSNITPLVKSIEQEYESKGISYGKHSLLNDFEVAGKPINNKFMQERVSSQEVITLAHTIIKRIKNIKGTEYYRFNHKNKIEKIIQPTNILIHDAMYSKCYRFWLDNYVISDSNYYLRENITYYNYFVINLLAYLKEEISESHPLNIKDERVMFEPICFTKGIFEYLIKCDDERLGLQLQVNINISKSEVLHAKYYLLTTLKYDETNQPGIDEIIKEKKLTYDDVILITQNNLVGKFDAVLNISIYQDYNQTLIKNLFKSVSLLFEVDSGVYENICPVCGAKHPNYEIDHYECSSCHSNYVIANKNKKPLLWIKTLRKENQ